MENKKAFQSNANHPLADSLHCMMNKFEYMSGDVWTGFQSQDCSDHCMLHCHMTVSIAAEYLLFHLLFQPLGGPEPIPQCAVDKHSNRMSHTDLARIMDVWGS